MEGSSVLKPDPALVRAADLVAHELGVLRPLGVERFERSYEHQPLVGTHANFVGSGPDGTTRLEISYLPGPEPRAVEAFYCAIVRGSERFSVSHYLAHLKQDHSFLSNSLARPSREFIHSTLQTLADPERFGALSAVLAGAELPAVPYNWEGYR